MIQVDPKEKPSRLIFSSQWNNLEFVCNNKKCYEKSEGSALPKQAVAMCATKKKEAKQGQDLIP